MTTATQIGECGKRCYGSPDRAKRANRHAGFRLRAYRCERCRAWHVTSSEKR
jgi:hypothetical protein